MSTISLRKKCLVLLSGFFLLGCGRSEAQKAKDEPWRADLAAARAYTFVPPAQARAECLGRLVFNLDREIQWPTFYHPEKSEQWGSSFSLNVYEADGMSMGSADAGFGKVRIAVFDIPSGEVLRYIKGDLPSHMGSGYSLRLAEAAERLRDLRALPDTPKNRASIAREERMLKLEREDAQKFASSHTKFAPGISNVEGFGESWVDDVDKVSKFSRYTAYLTLKHHVYKLESTRLLNEKFSAEDHASNFTALLKNLKPRVAGEIPQGAGVCIPFGFIADDGRAKVDFKQSFRTADAPGVLHTIHTGNYENYKGNPPGLLALALASTGTLGSAEEAELKPSITKRIGPRSYMLGGLKATQGGFAAKIAQPGSQAFEAYSMLTGYASWEGADDLPFIVVEMNSKSTKRAPELRTNPPPFALSLARHEDLLKSIRLRPVTTPGGRGR
jgi:hypothetical protein